MQYVTTATINGIKVIVMDEGELEKERRSLLARLQWINQVLGYPPIPTGKQMRMCHLSIDEKAVE